MTAQKHPERAPALAVDRSRSSPESTSPLTTAVPQPTPAALAALDEAERGILTRWAEKMDGGYADSPTPDKKQHARTILRYEATIAALLAAARRGTGDTELLTRLAEHAAKHPSSTTATIVISDKLREWLAARAAHPEGPQHG